MWAWLTAIVAVSAVARLFFALRIDAPWIVVDELIYSELARGLAAGDGFAIRGVATHGYGLVYPLVIAPAYLLFDSLPHAYAAVKTINAVAMSLAALPAYFLARRVLPVGLSLFAAVLAVALPSLLYAGEVMTENAFYPDLPRGRARVRADARAADARAAAAPARLLRRRVPDPRAGARVLPGDRSSRRSLLGTWRSFRVLYGTLGGAAARRAGRPARARRVAARPARRVLRRRRLRATSRPRCCAGSSTTSPSSTSTSACSRSRRCSCCFALWNRLPRSLRPFLAATASLSTFLLLEVSAFASLPSVQRIEERNLFYLAPLMLIALLVWVDQGAPRPPLTAGAAAVLAAALPAVIPYERLIGVPSQSDTLLMLALWRVHERWVELDEVVAVVVACSIARGARVPARAAAVRDRASARRARVLPGGRAADLGADGVRGGGRARRGDAQAGPRVGRQGGRGSGRGRRALDRQRLALLGLAERVLQPAASAPSSTRARRWRAGSRRRR